MTQDAVEHLSEVTHPLTVRLKMSTHDSHESLDQLIMKSKPFASLGNYARFLRMQYCFHWLVQPLYHNETLNKQLSGLEGHCRLEQVINDCLDLMKDPAELPLFVKNIPVLNITNAQALGWLYAIEGSNIGGAFLFKFAKELGCHEEFGASHLAGHSDGRGKHWREFKHKIDALSLNETEQLQACEGAAAAFSFVRDQARAAFLEF
ncbi:biliverdin-producing heme oxygenase [Pseudomonas sp. HK3]|jgi:heme oxygenase